MLYEGHIEAAVMSYPLTDTTVNYLLLTSSTR